MEALDQKYKIELDSLKGAVQSSDLLTAYLDSEEEEDYLALRAGFEPTIEQLYGKVALDHPLQLISLERELLDPDFEGLFLGRILGYTVLRGEIDELYRYKRPQDHFKDVLLAICHSSNFEMIKTRIGQSVQIGFALSSHIWISNLIEVVPAKRVRHFLESQVIIKYRDAQERQIGYRRYSSQFKQANYHSAEFPATANESKVLFSALQKFLIQRIKMGVDNTNLVPHIKAFLENPEMKYSKEYVVMLTLFGAYFEHATDHPWLKQCISDARQQYEPFNEMYFNFLRELLRGDLEVGKESDSNLATVIDFTIDDDLSTYYQLLGTVHGKGYVHDDAIEAVRAYYDKHEGMSVINECLRRQIFGNFKKLLSNLPEEDYTAYFEINKTFAAYMQIFNNQQFNLGIKQLSLQYVGRLIKRYTDKRGKDYQDIKKFVSHTFLELGFLNEKGIVELFKTRRKKKATA